MVKRLVELRQEDVAVCKILLMEILLYLDRTLLPQTEKNTYFTAKQYHLAQSVHDRLIAEPFREHNVATLAAEYGVSRTSLNRYFEAAYGDTVSTWIRKYRLREAAELLRKTDRSTAEISLAVGYANPSKFSAAFKREFDVPPSVFRRMKEGGKTG